MAAMMFRIDVEPYFFWPVRWRATIRTFKNRSSPPNALSYWDDYASFEAVSLGRLRRKVNRYIRRYREAASTEVVTAEGWGGPRQLMAPAMMAPVELYVNGDIDIAEFERRLVVT